MSFLPKALARALLAGAMTAGLATGATAQMELKIIAPAAPGGGWDQTARSMQQALTTSGSAKNVQVTNVPGAGGTVGLAQFVNAKGDPNQLLVNGFVMVGAILTNKSPVSLDQTTPIARLTAEPLAIVVTAESPIKSAKDLAAAVKTDPAKVTWAGGSAGGVDHIAVALFAKEAGADPTKINYIPFSGGGEALAAILGGKVTAGISGYGEFEGQVKAGKLRVIALTSPQRVQGIDAPTLKEAGHQPRDHQLALGGGASGHHARPAQGPHRCDRQDGQVQGMGRHPEAEGLGRRLSLGRRLRGVPETGTGAGEGGPHLGRPRQILNRRATGFRPDILVGRGTRS